MLVVGLLAFGLAQADSQKSLNTRRAEA